MRSNLLYWIDRRTWTGWKYDERTDRPLAPFRNGRRKNASTSGSWCPAYRPRRRTTGLVGLSTRVTRGSLGHKSVRLLVVYYYGPHYNVDQSAFSDIVPGRFLINC